MARCTGCRTSVRGGRLAGEPPRLVGGRVPGRHRVGGGDGAVGGGRWRPGHGDVDRAGGVLCAVGGRGGGGGCAAAVAAAALGGAVLATSSRRRRRVGWWQAPPWSRGGGGKGEAPGRDAPGPLFACVGYSVTTRTRRRRPTSTAPPPASSSAPPAAASPHVGTPVVGSSAPAPGA